MLYLLDGQESIETVKSGCHGNNTVLCLPDGRFQCQVCLLTMENLNGIAEHCGLQEAGNNLETLSAVDKAQVAEDNEKDREVEYFIAHETQRKCLVQDEEAGHTASASELYTQLPC